MIITISQIVVLVCTVLFFLSSIIAIYMFAETFTTKKIKLTNPTIAWNIISNASNFNLWWDKFKKNTFKVEDINILDQSPYTHLKFAISKELDVAEIWTFYLLNKNNNYILYIKKQVLSNNNYKNFLNKYIKNKQDINLYTNNLKRVLSKISNN